MTVVIVAISLGSNRGLTVAKGEVEPTIAVVIVMIELWIKSRCGSCYSWRGAMDIIEVCQLDSY